MNTADYLNYCRAELNKSLTNTHSGMRDDKHRYRVEGLLHAARLLELASAQDIQSMIEDEHLAVFGESVAERQARKDTLKELKQSDPDAYFDIPTIERRS